jgi:hypothetical protein
MNTKFFISAALIISILLTMSILAFGLVPDYLTEKKNPAPITVITTKDNNQSTVIIDQNQPNPVAKKPPVITSPDLNQNQAPVVTPPVQPIVEPTVYTPPVRRTRAS